MHLVGKEYNDVLQDPRHDANTPTGPDESSTSNCNEDVTVSQATDSRVEGNVWAGVPQCALQPSLREQTPGLDDRLNSNPPVCGACTIITLQPTFPTCGIPPTS
jgi:hypothetical protein